MNDNTTIPTVAERLRWLGQIARRHWIVLVSVTAVATVAAVFVGARSAKEYSARAKLVLDGTQLVGVTSSTPLVPNPDPERDVNTKVDLILTAPVANAVNSRLRLHMPTSALLAKVHAATESTSNLVDVTATDRSPTQAMAIANAFGQEYVRYRREIAQSSLRASADSLRAQIANLSPTSPQATALQTELRQLNVALAGQTGGAIVVAQAKRASAVSPGSVMVAGVAGALVGLLLAATIIAFLELTDRRLKDGEDFSSAFGVRMLAEIPRARPTRQGSFLVDGNRAQTEAYDALAGQLLLAGRRRALATVMITSPGSDDGKTALTFGLARALARLDRRVLVVETDGRRSVLAPYSDRDPKSGLSDVVKGTSKLADAIVSVDPRDGDATEANPGSGSVWVLPAGSGELPIHRVLSRPEVASVIAAGREIADFVLIDGPSTHRLHDALELVDAVDAALMVARLRWTSAERLHNALESLYGLGITTLGLALTGTRVRGSSVTPSPRTGAVVHRLAVSNDEGHVQTWPIRQSGPTRPR